MEGDERLKLLLDTHVWLWSLVSPQRLSRKARSALGSAKNELWLSPVSTWELHVLAERDRVKLDDLPGRWIREALALSPVNEAPLSHVISIRSREVTLPHQDPADRFIVATALVYELTLVTADDVILAARPCPLLAAS